MGRRRLTLFWLPSPFLNVSRHCSRPTRQYKTIKFFNIVIVLAVLCVMSVYASYRHMKSYSQMATNLLYASLVSGDFSRLPSPKPMQLSVSTVEASTQPSLQTA